ncbi:MAG: glycosyltransferase [Bacteroidaceae bacterium]|nr:glycosyltransferase [Bacteroidaceae bacterium]
MLDRKKVLFFLPPSVGGAERMTITIAKMLPREEFEVKFVIVGRELGDIINFIPSDYKTILLQIHGLWDFCTLRIINLLRKEKTHVVFASLMYLNARIIWASKLFGIKSIVRNNIDFFNALSKNRWYAKLSYRWADYIIAQQEEMRKGIIATTHSAPQKVITLNNPIDTKLIDEKSKVESPYDKEDKSIKFVWTARIIRAKGQDILIKAFNIVHRATPNSKLYLVGKYDKNDTYYQELMKYVIANKLSDSVVFTGFDNNPYKWVVNADCYVMPSKKEGLPNSLIDAMYLGKPVVATTCVPVISRIIRDGYNGILVAPEDVEAMAEAMQNALQLNNFEMTYIPANKEDFISLFRSL